MKSSNIGGQAVLEGIMMKNKDRYSVAVRTPDGGIEVSVGKFSSVSPWKSVLKIPFIRGIFNFADSLVLGVKTLMISAQYAIDDEDPGEEAENPGLTEEMKKKQEAKEKIYMNILMAVSVLFAVGIFMVLPYFLSSLLRRFIPSRTLLTVLEGAIRLGLFLLYLILISNMKDIKRTFMYHGAEHKCINCIEHGLELKVENVRISSKEHKRCGTSFLFFVMAVSVIFCFFITTPSPVLRVLYRIALLPLIAGVSYEIIRLAGSSDGFFINLLSRPGLWVQNFTTKEPDDSMIEVAIKAVEAVFDWRAYLAENFGAKDSGNAAEG